MFNYIKRRRRFLFSAAAGAAAAAAVYYWWHDEEGLDESTAQQPIITPSGQPKQRGDADVDDDDQSEQDMDGTMANHFEYIQGEAAPDQLEQLLPRLRGMLYQMTDVQSALASMPAGSTTRSKLLVMTQHSLARPLAAVWLIPLVDLLVRAKLNFIGRHMFLEEKLSKLRQPVIRAVQGMRTGVWGASPQRLPPRIHGNAVEAFLLCEYIEAVGCPWLVSQVLQVVGASLADVDLEAARGPEEMCALLQTLHADVHDALTLSLTSWAQLLLGDTAAPGPHQPKDPRQMGSGMLGPPGMLVQGPSPLLFDPQVAEVEAELQRDLRLAVCGASFAAAADAAVMHALRTLQMNMKEVFPTGPAPAPPATATSRVAAEGPGSQGGGSSSVTAGAASPGAPPGLKERVKSWGSSLCQTGSTVCSSMAWALGRAGSSTAAAGSIPRPPPTDMAQASSLHELPNDRPPRPLPRLLKSVQSACDPLFDNAHQLSKAIASLGPVLAFSASIFAKPVNEGSLDLVGLF